MNRILGKLVRGGGASSRNVITPCKILKDLFGILVLNFDTISPQILKISFSDEFSVATKLRYIYSPRAVSLVFLQKLQFVISFTSLYYISQLQVVESN